MALPTAALVMTHAAVGVADQDDGARDLRQVACQVGRVAAGDRSAQRVGRDEDGEALPLQPLDDSLPRRAVRPSSVLEHDRGLGRSSPRLAGRGHARQHDEGGERGGDSKCSRSGAPANGNVRHGERPFLCGRKHRPVGRRELGPGSALSCAVPMIRLACLDRIGRLTSLRRRASWRHPAAPCRSVAFGGTASASDPAAVSTLPGLVSTAPALLERVWSRWARWPGSDETVCGGWF